MLLNAFVFKELHHLFEHHHEHGIECTANGGDKHFHESLDREASCFICQFDISPTEEERILTPKQNVTVLVTAKIYTKHTLLVSRSVALPTLRGPPNFI